MKHKFAQTQVPIHELIAKRWSSRAFDLAKPVPRVQQLAMLEAARWAPTCFHEEPWRFVVFDRHQNESAWRQAQDCLAQWNRSWAEYAPLLILVVCATHFTLSPQIQGEPNRWSAYDTGAAVENMVLQATSMGLISRQIGGFDEAMARKAFAVPEQFQLLAFVALGYPSPSIDHLYEKHQQAELAVRNRTAFEHNVFAGRWQGEFPSDNRD